MNIYITINYVLLAIVFTFLLVEGMSAILFIYDRKSLPNVKKYLDPIWGIVGTFVVFFVVNTEVLYPSIMPSIDYLYVFPILLATLLFIGRNVFLIFSEYIWRDSKLSQLMLARIYSLITFIIIIILLSIFISIISGIGTNATLTGFSTSIFLSDPYTLCFIAGTLLIAFGLSFVFYKIEKMKVLSPIVTVLGLLLFIFSISRLGLRINYITYIIAAVIALTSIVYYVTGKARREIIFVVVFLSVISINFLNYGKVFGTKSLTAYLNNSAVSSASILVTVVGGALLTAMLLFFLYMYRLPDKENSTYNYKESDDEEEKVSIANLYIIHNNNKVNGKEYKAGKNRKR
jgi:cytochrome d ubiquinol oxidase subunit II